MERFSRIKVVRFYQFYCVTVCGVKDDTLLKIDKIVEKKVNSMNQNPLKVSIMRASCKYFTYKIF